MTHDCVDLGSFTFQPLTAAKPPDTKGVYVIRVASVGEPVEHVLRQVMSLAGRLQWPLVEEKISSRIGRLRRVNECPLVYIGAAAPSTSSKHTVAGRYKDFAGRHTIMVPLWALVYHGWVLEYGWKASAQPSTDEQAMKAQYRAIHGDNLPALVSR